MRTPNLSPTLRWRHSGSVSGEQAELKSHLAVETFRSWLRDPSRLLGPKHRWKAAVVWVLGAASQLGKQGGRLDLCRIDVCETDSVRRVSRFCQGRGSSCRLDGDNRLTLRSNLVRPSLRSSQRAAICVRPWRGAPWVHWQVPYGRKVLCHLCVVEGQSEWL